MLTPRTDKTLCKNYLPRRQTFTKLRLAISKCKALPVPIVKWIRLAWRRRIAPSMLGKNLGLIKSILGLVRAVSTRVAFESER